MRVIKLSLILLILLAAWTAKSQWTINAGALKMYTLKIEGNSGPDNTRYLQGLINNQPDVLLARVKIDGSVFIFSETPINAEAIRAMLKSNSGIKAGKITEATFSKEEYYKAYTLFDFPAADYYSDKKPEKLYYQDKQKEEKAYSVAKSIWIEFFPDAYQEIQPAPKELTEMEQKEKAQKGSNIFFKSKTE
ncbi:MAG: hypothetical protein CVU05_11590 [Bacteroidetes bacterium HGW-Bacteroidetes-21]|jgi:hypothetical protein|nr:MAG: hypothetical protein CVU05_11590 [Bacteroidetes bacterium HGW-Bacteroidetes-21]